MARRKAPSTIDVNVTRDMIHWALTQKSTQCAIALAIRDANENFVFPNVTQEAISVSDRSTGMRYTWTDVPEKIQRWIDQFDRDPSKVKPFTLTLDLDGAEAKPMQHLSVQKAVELTKRRLEKKVNTRNQKRIPASNRGGIRFTSKRELRDVEVPPDAGII